MCFNGVVSFSPNNQQEDSMAMEINSVQLRDGSTLDLPVHVVERDGRTDRYPVILIRTRTGKKIHSGSAGSSVAGCGHWLKVNGERMQIDPARVDRIHLCENCFPVQSQAPAPEEEERDEFTAVEVVVHDAIGQGVDAKITRERGIISIVLIDSHSSKVLAPSAELDADALVEALRSLGVIS